MRTILRFQVVAAVATLSLAACNESTSVGELAPTDAEKVRALGLSPLGMRPHKDGYIVEGDIFVSRTQLERGTIRLSPPISLRVGQEGAETQRPTVAQPFEHPFSNQATIASPLTRGWAQSVTVDLTSLNSTEQGWVRAAMSDWNSVAGTVLHFSEASPGDITVTTYSDISTRAATGSLPSSSTTPGSSIQINVDFSNYGNSGIMERNMAHELGHTVGFRHTNWASLNEST